MELENPQELKLKNNQSNQEAGNFQIDANFILKEFDCTICFCSIEDCYVTRCGHVFCKGCIAEAINRHHRCPSCQAQLNQEDVFKNYHFNNIKKIIIDEREKKQQIYLQNVYKIQDEIQKEDGLDLQSPLEDFFRKYLSKMILSYKNKFGQTQNNFIQAEKVFQRDFDIQMQKLINENEQVDSNINQKIQDMTKQFKIQKENLQKQVDIVNNFYLESLEKTLEQAVPDPSLLDVKVSIQIPQKNMKIESYYIQQNSFINEFTNFLEDQFLKKNDPIQDIESVKKQNFVVSVPMEYTKLFQDRILNEKIEFNFTAQQYQDYVNQKLGLDQRIVAKQLDTQELFISMRLTQGNSLFIIGDIKTKKDIPAECMTYSFKKENPVILDYFSCKDCNIKWVCPGCKDTCHKGHVVQPFVQQHNATWACCYCVTKTNNCKALNKFSKV